MGAGALLQMGLGPADVQVARRVNPEFVMGGERVDYPAESVSLSRDAVPHSEHGVPGLPDPHRPSEEYHVGKPFSWPGISLSFTSSIQEWKDDPPLGFVKRLIRPPQIHTTPGRASAPVGYPVNIQRPPAIAYGSLFATYPAGHPGAAAIPGTGGP